MFKINGSDYQVYLTEMTAQRIKKELDKMPQNEMITTKELIKRFNLSMKSGSILQRLKHFFPGYYAKYNQFYVWGNKRTIELFKKTAGL